MVNRVAGEIHKKGGILQQTFGETVANAYGLVFYQAADGKLYRAQANAETTVAGVLYLCADAATVKGTVGNALAQGRAEKTGWSWIVGKLVYVSPTVAGGLTQTVPTGRRRSGRSGSRRDPIRSTSGPCGAPERPTKSTSPTSLRRMATSSSGARPHGGRAGTTIGAHPLVPDLRNRILRIKDSSGNDLEIHQVWIPLFDSEGFSDPNLNGIECGGFWIDKYQACMHDATNVSRGSSTVNDPGTHGAASKPGVVIWTDINWTNAKIATRKPGRQRQQENGHLCRVRRRQHDTVLRRRDHRSDRRRSGSRRAVSPTSAVSSRPAATRTRTQTPRNSSRSTRHSRKTSRATTPTRSCSISCRPVRVVQPGGMGDEAPLPVRPRLPERQHELG